MPPPRVVSPPIGVEKFVINPYPFAATVNGPQITVPPLPF
jgi:hypothetical protein